MASEGVGRVEGIRVFFFPFISPGHMIPLLDMATLLSHRGISATVITTPGNEPLVRPTIDRSSSSPNPINLLLLSFPSSAHHLLPSGKENLSFIPASSFSDLYNATFSLHQPLLHLLQLHRPDCLISDSVYHWTADIAQNLSIPHLIFHGPGIFALCVHDYLELHSPWKNSERFLVEGLPHRIELTRKELPETFQYPIILDTRREAEKRSYGIIVNSFYELEPEYGDLYRKEPGRKAWFIGPVSLCNISDSDKAGRGGMSSSGEWLTWLDSKPARSVLYVCFGSLCEFSGDQLTEIAAGLEASGHPFVWVVRKAGGWRAPETEKGMVITGWAPQILILNHPAIGGFMTHCGWNSTLEAVAAGVPLIAWPLFYEQFINEKFVTKVLRIGVRVEREGRNVLLEKGEKAVVGRQEIERAVTRAMGRGEEAEEMRRRAREYGEKARKAAEKGGSSYEDLGRLIEDLVALRVVETGV